MNETGRSTFEVIDEHGVRGTLDLSIAPPAGAQSRLVLVRFADGSQVYADAANFVERADGSFAFAGSFAGLQTAQNQAALGNAPAIVESDQMVIPILAEQIRIARKKVLTGGVRVHKTINERTEIVDEPTLREDVAIERVAVNQFVTQAPPVRYEGDTMIVPLLEEVMVVEKRLVLREEVRVTKARATVRNPQPVVLRSETATLERIVPEQSEIRNAPADE